MPVKKSKSRKGKKPKIDKSIMINIKNVMKQIQNEPPRDYIRFVKNPKRELNFGSQTRAFNPPATYASNPLSAFPSLESVLNAPPIADQLKSHPAIYRPDVLQVETNPNDIQQSKVSKREVPSSAIPTARGISTGASSQSDFASPVRMTPLRIGTAVSAFTDVSNVEDDPQDDTYYDYIDAMRDEPRFGERWYGGSPVQESAQPAQPAQREFIYVDREVDVVDRIVGPRKRKGPLTQAELESQREIIPSNPNRKSAGLFRGGQVKSRMG